MWDLGLVLFLRGGEAGAIPKGETDGLDSEPSYTGRISNRLHGSGLMCLESNSNASP